MEVEKVNFKKLFPGKKVTQKKILDFFDKKGFFIVLGLCLTIIGVTAYLVVSNNDQEEIITHDMVGNMEQSIAYFEEDKEVIANNQAEDDISISNDEVLDENFAKGSEGLEGQVSDMDLAKDNEEISVAEQDVEIALDETAKAVEVNKTSEIDEISEGNETVVEDHKEEVAETASISKFTMPVYGDIILEFAVDKLVYSKTLNEWRAHTGVGISSSRGTPVKVVADGVVSSIKNDPRLGITVIVEHSKDLKTVYANLASDDMVTPNQKVKQGEVIGSVGDTAVFKSADPSHLHFEVLKENQPVDPIEYLPID